ncbi:hypothetical protein D3C73_1059740 [compost metagenome]
MKLRPGTPSMLAGSRMPCQWMEVGCWPSVLRTNRSTVWPSRQRRIGAGSEPLTVIAGRVRPVKLASDSPMASSTRVSLMTAGAPARRGAAEAAASARCGIPAAAMPATTPPAAMPCTKRRRDGMGTAPGPGGIRVLMVVTPNTERRQRSAGFGEACWISRWEGVRSAAAAVPGGRWQASAAGSRKDRGRPGTVVPAPPAADAGRSCARSP